MTTRDSIPLEFPLLGLDDDLAKARQRGGTTPLARNVRSIDPVSGRARGAQRPGMSKFFPDPLGDGPIQALAGVSYDRDRVQYTQLTQTPNTAVSPPSITTEWSKRPISGGSTWHVRTDPFGNVYVLDGPGTIVKYNSDGEQLALINLPLRLGEELVPKLQVDELGAIYAAARAITGQAGSRLWRYKHSDDSTDSNTYEKHWELETDGRVIDFAVRAGVLYAVEDFSTESDYSTLRAWSFITTSVPEELWTRNIPNPVNALAVGPSGDAFTVHGPNSSRGASTDGGVFETSSVSWTPYELANASERIYFWTDAKQIEGLSEGDDIVIWEDRRFLDTDVDPSTLNGQPSSPGLNPAPHDVTNRAWHRPQGGWVETGSPSAPYAQRPGVAPPTYDPAGFGELPGVRFSKDVVNQFGSLGNALETLSNVDPVGKSDTDGDGIGDADGQQDGSKAFGYAGNGQDTAFALFLVFRADYDETAGVPAPQVLLAHGSDSLTYSTVLGRILVMLHTADGVTVTPGAVYVELGSGMVTEAGGSTSAIIASGTIDPISKCGILTIQIPGYLDDTGAVEHNRCAVRLNGRPMDAFTLTNSWTSSAPPTDPTTHQRAPYTVLGKAVSIDTGQSDILPAGSTPEPFNGWVAESLVVLGDTNVMPPSWVWPNNVAVTQPLRDAGATVRPGEAAGRHITFDAAGDVFSGSVDHPGVGVSANSSGATEVEIIEGYLAHRWGIPDILPSEEWPVKAGETPTTDMGANAQDSGAGGSQLWRHHPFGGTGRVPLGTGGDITQDATSIALKSQDPIMAKWKASFGEAAWALSGGGMGYGVAVSDDGGVFSIGPKVPGNGPSGKDESDVIARKVVDEGATYSVIEGDGAWVITGTDPEVQTYKYARLDVDAQGNFYWPVANSGGFLSLKLSGDANNVARIDGDTGSVDWFYSLPNDIDLFGVALGPRSPSMEAQGIEGPEFVYVCGDDDGDSTINTLYKLRVVAATQVLDDGVSVRDTKVVAVSSGILYERDSASGAVKTVQSDPVFLEESPFVSLLVHRSLVFGTDGEHAIVYDPKKGTVEPWKAKGAAEIPRRFKLMASWRDRIVVARTPDSPTNWFMSAQGDPYDFDTSPPVLTVQSAVSGTGPRGPGQSPDIINALIPFSDDLMLFGCDRTIQRLTGDPLAAGDFDLVSDQVGVAFGSAWTKDWRGVIYFLGSRGGIFAMPGGSQPERISHHRIERRLQEIDLSRFRVHLAYDYETDGLMVLQISLVGSGIASRGWFYDTKNGSWWEDDYTVTDVQPSAAAVIDGDRPDDRVLALGCEDGYVRKVDRLAPDDDGAPIDSEVWWLMPTSPTFDGRFGYPKFVLAGDQGGATVSMHYASSADARPIEVGRARIEPGLNPALPIRARGGAVWLSLRNSAAGERWAFEEASIRASRSSRRRVR